MVSRPFVWAACAVIVGSELLESTWRSVLQLWCMVWSVREARELRYAQRIFEDSAHPLSKQKQAVKDTCKAPCDTSGGGGGGDKKNA